MEQELVEGKGSLQGRLHASRWMLSLATVLQAWGLGNVGKPVALSDTCHLLFRGTVSFWDGNLLVLALQSVEMSVQNLGPLWGAWTEFTGNRLDLRKPQHVDCARAGRVVCFVLRAQHV